MKNQKAGCKGDHMELTKTELEDIFAATPDSPLFENVACVLNCSKDAVHVVEPIRSGNMNLIYLIEVDGKKYVYRHPGPGTEQIINRESEAVSQQVAGDLGIDSTFIYQHPTDGWKLSRYIEHARCLDYHNKQDVAGAMELARKLHSCKVDSGFYLDLHEDTLKQIELLTPKWRNYFEDFDELYAIAERLNAEVKRRGLDIVLCHNDFYDTNFLISDDEMNLIDWEFSAMSDYASDLSVFICCSDYTFEEALDVLKEYFQRDLTEEELFHCIAYLGVVSFHWLVWALYQEVVGASTPFLDIYHNYTRMFEQAALEMLDDTQVATGAI